MEQILKIKKEETDEDIVVEPGDSDDEFVEPVYLNYFNEQLNKDCKREAEDEVTINNNVWIKEEIDLKEETPDYSDEEEDFVESTTTSHSRLKWHKCPKLHCNYRTLQKGHLNRHLNTHNTNPQVKTQFLCYICGRRFSQKQSMIRHINDIHHSMDKPENPTIFHCKLCDYKTTTRGLLMSHRDKHKDASDAYICFICNLKTKYRRNLRVHMETHRDKEDLRTYRCSVCRFKTRQAYCLKRHFLSKSHLKRMGKLEEYTPRGMKMKVEEEKSY